MNKTHVAITGGATGYVALGLALFFPKLSTEQIAFIAGGVPTAVMTAIAVLEVIAPKTKAVFDAAETVSGDAPKVPGG